MMYYTKGVLGKLKGIKKTDSGSFGNTAQPANVLKQEKTEARSEKSKNLKSVIDAT